MNDALLSSKNMCWCTPPDFFAELDREFHFELDPASTDKSAKCAKHFTPDDDGLKQDWGGIACFAIRHTAEQSPTGYAKATKKARQMVGTQIAVTTKLAATEAIDTQMVMGVNMRTGQIEIAEYDGQIRGQMDLSDFADTAQDPEPEEMQAAAPAPVQNPTGKPLDLKNRGKQAPAAAAELVPGRDYDPDTGEVYETAGQSADDHQTTGGRNNMKVVTIAPAKEA